ncbi:sorting nexin-32 isoform X2 [Erinaceus europaeus]|uniref:Sorting nexin-32 isoform X2 n=1 Tax=Erinaceus europaeus TaxID=9365 RepID=A0ABM3W618_ERIEU|nr:sorting nexin-32 isoform X2 [Erinaceus europaeus]
MEEQPEGGKENKPCSTSGDLQRDSSLLVEISDAVSERDKVKTKLSVRGKSRKELLGGFLRNLMKSADEVLITGVSGLKAWLTTISLSQPP